MSIDACVLGPWIASRPTIEDASPSRFKSLSGLPPCKTKDTSLCVGSVVPAAPASQIRTHARCPPPLSHGVPALPQATAPSRRTPSSRRASSATDRGAALPSAASAAPRTSARKRQLPAWQRDEDDDVAAAGRDPRSPHAAAAAAAAAAARARQPTRKRRGGSTSPTNGGGGGRGEEGDDDGAPSAAPSAASSPALPRLSVGPRRPAGAITVKTLLGAGLVAAGERVLSVEYKGNVTWGDLNEEGQITFEGKEDG